MFLCLGQCFHHGHVESAAPHLLGHFESYLTAANHGGAATLAISRPLHDFFRVGYVSHHEMARAVDSRDGGFIGDAPVERMSAS